MSNHDALSVQIVVSDLDADELLQFEACLTDTSDEDVDVRIVNRGGALLNQVDDIAYTVMVGGVALNYLAAAINRIRLRFAHLTVFDFRNNTLVVTKHAKAGDMAGKCIIVGPEGEVTISKDQDDSALLKALKKVTSQE
jgi:hypothetical protein